MEILRKVSVGSDQEAPRHPEVNQENETALETDNQILAAPLHGGDSTSFEQADDVLEIHRAREPLVEDLDRFERPAGEDRRQLSSDGLDLGEFGHAR